MHTTDRFCCGMSGQACSPGREFCPRVRARSCSITTTSQTGSSLPAPLQTNTTPPSPASACFSRSLGSHRGHTTAISSFHHAASAASSASPRSPSPLLISGGQDGHVKVWDVRAKAAAVADVAAHCSEAGSGAVHSVRTCSELQLVVTAAADKGVCVLEPRRSFAPLYRLDAHDDFPYSLHVAGSLCLSGDGAGMLLVHDLRDGRLLYGMGANRHAVQALAATRDRLVAVGDDGNLMLYAFDDTV